MSAAYCTVAEITTLGINPEALRALDVPVKQAAIDWASDVMDGYIGAQFVLPLKNWGLDVRGCCARLAAIRLMQARGASPEDTDRIDEMLDREYRWLKGAASGTPALQVIDSSPDGKLGVPSSQPRIVSASSRGFSRLPGDGSPFGCGGGGSFGV